MSDDLSVLNAARRWWLECMPHIGGLRPTDDEVLEAYAKRWRADPLGMGLRRMQELRAEATEPLPDWERELLEKQERERRAEDAQRAVRRGRLGPMPAEFDALAVYNAERWRGLVHTAEYDAAMAQLQCRFNEWAGLTQP